MNIVMSMVFGWLLLTNLTVSSATPAMAATVEYEQVTEQVPEEKPAMQHHRGPKPIIVPLDDSASAVMWKPDLSTVPLTMTAGKIDLPKTGVDNYHVVVAEQQKDNLKNTFIYYIYRYGKPSGHSTNEVTTANKTELEIMPDPIPREHDRYYSQQSWSFIVNFQGKPLSSHVVSLSTENGTLIEQSTDGSGKVTFVLPNDFRNVISGNRDKRSASMTIKTKLQTDGKQWQTQLVADYSISESNWRSTKWGVIVMIIGLIIGGLFIRLNKAKAGKRK